MARSRAATPGFESAEFPWVLVAMRCPEHVCTSTSTDDRTTLMSPGDSSLDRHRHHHANDDLAELFAFMPGLAFISTSFGRSVACSWILAS
ncbi:hypothetical protein AB1N83_008373 [Pleurotus pulmonarius]